MPDSSAPELAHDEVHIWTWPLRAPVAVLSTFGSLLDAEESRRAGRFRFPHLRESFVVSHGMLRWLLARYLGLPSRDVSYAHGEQGKPRVTQAPASSPRFDDLHFSLTHSGGMAAVALARNCAMGLDLERIRPTADADQIAGRYFCPEEAAELGSLPPAERESAFFACWTRKEAYIKAIGDGFSCPLDAFRVTLQAGQPARLLHIRGNAHAAAEWTLHDLNLCPECRAALAYRGPERRIAIRDASDGGAFSAIAGQSLTAE